MDSVSTARSSSPPSSGREGVARVVAELRALSVALDRLDQHAAHHLGLNRTDQRALDLIGQAETISPTALALALGMSTGATSTVIDRLESAGYVRRDADPDRRRGTVVRMTDHAARVTAALFDPLIRATAEHAAGFADTALSEITAFLEGHRAVILSHLAATTQSEDR